MSRPALSACDTCLRRTWLLGRLSAHLERERYRIQELLALGDDELLAAVAGRERTELGEEHSYFGADAAATARSRAARAGLRLVCRCHDRYPGQLREIPAPPAVLHVLGDVQRLLDLRPEETVAMVGARRPSEYGRALAFALARSATVSGLAVVSGMALGIDASAHEGALTTPLGMTVAVLAGSAHIPQPASRRKLHAEIAGHGAIVSELGPGAHCRRWGFLARNRLIAGLAGATLVVEGRTESGSLVTANAAKAIGRPVGAVPGNVTNELAAGPNALLADGARVIRNPQDVLDLLFGAGVRGAPVDLRPAPSDQQARVLEAIATGHDTAAALARAENQTALGMPGGELLMVLIELELAGYVRRGPGGRLAVIP
jgi:DNA processing protein